MKQLSLNKTFKFGEQLADLTQEDIAACPAYGQGVTIEQVTNGLPMPESVRERILSLPFDWAGKRKHTWIFIRPQQVTIDGPDTRSGNFYHLDVDILGRCVANSWDDFAECAVSFGDVSEVEFISEPMVIEAPDTPSSQDYVTLSGNFQSAFQTASPKNGQVVMYTGLDAHRAGKIRRSGHRLFIIAMSTDSPEKWP